MSAIKVNILRIKLRLLQTGLSSKLSDIFKSLEFAGEMSGSPMAGQKKVFFFLLQNNAQQTFIVFSAPRHSA
jgi:hypothetical protein